MDQGDADRQSLTDRADAADCRSEQIEAQADLDRDMIVDLQAEGAVTGQHAHDLEEALKSSRTIGKAIGILMESRKVSEDKAFAILKQASQDHNRKLREIAAELVQAAPKEHDLS